MSSSRLNEINSSVSLEINGISGQNVNIGRGGGLTTIISGLTSTNATNTFGTISTNYITVADTATFNGGISTTSNSSSFGNLSVQALTAASATVTGNTILDGTLTVDSGITSNTLANTFGTNNVVTLNVSGTSSLTTLNVSGTTTTSILNSTSGNFSSTLAVHDLATFYNGITSTVNTNTFGSTTISSLTGTSATFSGTVNFSGSTNFSNGLNVTSGTTSIGALSASSGSISSLTVSTFTATGSSSLGSTSISSLTTTNETITGTLTLNNTTISTSTSTGNLVSSGGIATTDNVSIGNQLQLFNSGNYTGLKASSSSNNSVFTLPSSLPTNSYNYLISDTSGNLSFSASNVYNPTNAFSGNNNQSSPSNVTGLSFTSGYFQMLVTVNVIATTNLTQLFQLNGILSSTIGWDFKSFRISGDETNLEFTITSSGQVQYTSNNYPGFVSLTISWQESDSIFTQFPINLSVGTNTTGTVLNTGNLLNVNGSMFQDTHTANSGTVSSFYGTFIGSPSLSATNSSITTTTAATFCIQGPVNQGTNETFTNNYSLLVQSGLVYFGGNLNVIGSLTTGSLSITGSTTLNALTVTNGTTLNTLSTSGASTLNSLTVNNSSTLASVSATSINISGSTNVTNGVYINNSGNSIYLNAPSSFTSYNFNLPVSAGTSGQALISNGTNSMSWTNLLNSIALTVPGFLALTGSPLTANGTIGISYSGTPLPVLNGGTGTTTGTGTGNVVLSSSPTLTSANLITPTIGVASGTSLSLSSQFTSTVTTGTSPFIIDSTTLVTNLNANYLNGNTFAIPGSIGSTTPNSGSFTSLYSSSFTNTGVTNLNSTVNISGAVSAQGISASSLTTSTLSVTSTSTLAGASLSSTLNMNSNSITNLATPVNPTDGVNKSYVDAMAQGLSVKDSVIASSTVNGNLSSSFANGSVIDGVTLATGNRILIQYQSNAIQNGIYIVTTGTPTRSSDMPVGSSAAGSFVFVEQGTINANSGFICSSTPGSDIVGTNNLAFTQFSGSGEITAGTGLSKSGNTLSVNASQSQITTVGTLNNLLINSSLNINGSSSGTIAINATSGSYNFNLPITLGSIGQVLTTQGNTGILNWTTPITSITISVPGFLTLTGSPLTANGTIGISYSGTPLPVLNGGTGTTTSTGTGNVVLSNSPTLTSANLITPTIGVASGTSLSLSSQFTSTVTTGTSPFIIDSTTLVNNLNANLLNGNTFASPGPIGSTSPNTSIFTQVSFVGSGSNSITVSATNNASNYNFILPDTIGTSGQVLTTQSSGAFIWTTPINSIAISVPGFLALTGSPLTANGTIGISYSGLPLPVLNGGTGTTTSTGSGNVVLSNSPTLVTPTIGAATGTSLTLSGQFTSTLATGTPPLVVASSTLIPNLNASYLSGNTFTNPGPIGNTTANTGTFTQLNLNGSTSGSISLIAPSSFTSYNLNLPTTAGTSGQIFTSAGPGSAITFTSTTGTGNVVLNTSPTVNTSLIISNGSYSVTLNPSNMTSSYNWNYPVSQGTTGQILSLGASNLLTWVSTNGSGNVVLTTSPILVTPTLGVATGTSLTLSSQFISTVATGTSPLVIASTTVVTNLNANLLNGYTFGNPGTIGNTTAYPATFTTLTGGSTTLNSLTVTNLSTLNGGLNVIGSSVIGSLSATTGVFSSTLNVSGQSTLAATNTNALTSTTGSFSGNVNMNSNQINNLGTPSVSTDASNKSYVDNSIYNLNAKNTVVAATTQNQNLTTDFISGSVIDGVTLVTGNRILIKNQTTGSQNGIYIVTSGAPTRSLDFASGTNCSGSYVFILFGTVNGESAYIVTNVSGSDVVGTNSLTFAQTSASSQNISAGTGLSLSSGVLSVNSSQPQITTIGTLSNLSVGGNVNTSTLTVNSVSIIPNSSDIPTQVSFNGTQNVTNANITGLLFSYTTVRSFYIQMAGVIIATTSLYSQYEIKGCQNSSGNWYFVVDSIGDDLGITFAITSAGQVTYTCPSISGFSSLTFKFKASTITL